MLFRSAPDRALEINQASGNNLRLTYNDSNGTAANYADFLMSASGDLTLSPSGNGMYFQNDVDAVAGIQFLDADGGTPILNIDTTNEYVGIGTASPGSTLEVNGDINISQTASYGSELITNGTFDTDTTGWTAVKATLSSVAGGQSGKRLRAEYSGGIGNGSAFQTIATQPGVSYSISVYFLSGTSDPSILVGSSVGSSAFWSGGYSTGTWTQATGTFQADSTTTYITLFVQNPGIVFYDEISVTEINVGNLSINGVITGAGSTSGGLFVNDSGYVGIMDLSPDEQLKVVGGMCVADSGADTCTTAAGDIDADGAINANNFDLAENYVAGDISIAAGDIVVSDPADPKTKVIKADQAYQFALGVISTSPSVRMGYAVNAIGFDESQLRPVGILGRVPVKVATTNGAIAVDTPIAASALSGFGMRAAQSGQIVGRALESLNTAGSCPSVASVDAIVWPADEGDNAARPCFRLPDGTYVGKVLAFVNVQHFAVGSGEYASLDMAADSWIGLSDTAGRISFNDGAVTDTVSVVDAYFAIGTTTADERLTVAGNALFQDNVFVGSNMGYTIPMNGDDLYVSDDAQVGGDLLVTGNVGIGTTAPSAKLDVEGTLNADELIQGDVSFTNSSGTGVTLDLNIMDSTLGTGGFTGIDLNISGMGSGTGEKTAIHVNGDGSFSGNLLYLTSNNVSILTVTRAEAIFSVPVRFNAASETTMADDLHFTNIDSSYIRTDGDLFMVAGNTGNIQNIHLATVDGGVVFVDSDLTIGTADSRMVIEDGSLCVDSGMSRCPTNPINGTIYAENTSIIGIDLAETYPTIDRDVEAGDIVSVDTVTEVVVDNAVATQIVKDELKGIAQTELPNASNAKLDATVTRELADLSPVEIQNKIKSSSYVKRSQGSSDPTVIGVVSTKPGLTLGAHGPNAEKYPDSKMVPVALAGRVPVKISTLGGEIKPGDAIAASVIPGVGQKAVDSGVVVGRALEAFTAADIESVMMVDGIEVGIGQVTVFINVGYFVAPSTGLPDDALRIGGTGYAGSQVTSAGSRIDTNGLIDQNTTFSGTVMVFGTTYLDDTYISGKLTAGDVTISDNQIDVMGGDLVLQGVSGGDVIFGDEAVVIDRLGNMKAKGTVQATRFVGSDESRGQASLRSGETVISVQRTWKDAPTYVQVTPTYETTIWVTGVSANGFEIHVSTPAPAGQEVYWSAMW